MTDYPASMAHEEALETLESGLETSLDQVEGLTAESISPFKQAVRRFRHNRSSMLALIALTIFVLFVVLAPITARYGVNEAVFKAEAGRPNQFLSPRSIAWFGTDDIGRDLYSRIIYGVRVSLIIGLFSALTSVLIGVAIGALAGWVGGRIDDVLMRVTDVFLAFPFLVALLVIRQFLGQVPWITAIIGKPDSVRFIVILLSVLGWTVVARIVRGQVMTLKEREFVEAARALGASGPRIVFQHVLPNAIGPILVALTLSVVGAIVAESTLGFFGYGPNAGSGNTSLGNLVGGSKIGVQTGYWWLVLFPCLALVILALCINYIGEGLRDATDPKASGGRA